MSQGGSDSVDLGRGLTLSNPVGLASGTAGYGFELEQLIDINRLGALYTKGTTVRARDGNPPPRVAETGGGMLNSIGLQNPGVDAVAAGYAPRWRGWAIPIIVNIAGGSVEDYVHCVTVLEPIEEVAVSSSTSRVRTSLRAWTSAAIRTLQRDSWLPCVRSPNAA